MSLLEARYRESSGRHASVAAVWSFAAGDASESIVAADGCFDLIVRIDADGRPHAFVYEPEARAQIALVDPGTRLAGVRVRPGHGAALVERRVDLFRAAERLAGADASELESLVASAIEDHARPPNVITDFVARARATGGTLRLTTAVSSARERELQRASRRWLGVTPKSFLRIERVWAAREAIRDGAPLAAIAADLGYADQAHLTRDVRALLGATPRQLRPVGFLQEAARPSR